MADAPWQPASPNQPHHQLLPARSTHNPDYVLYAGPDVDTLIYTLTNEATGQSREITGRHGLYYAADVAEGIVCGGVEETHDRNFLRLDGV